MCWRAPAATLSSRGDEPRGRGGTKLPRRGSVSVGATSPADAVGAGVGRAAPLPASCQLPREERAASVGLTVLTGQNICHNKSFLNWIGRIINFQ